MMITLVSQSKQLDLFTATEESVRELERAQWRAQFERADWVAPYDCGLGPAGTVVRGWRCPDPECGQVEVNSCVLNINHGWDPDVPGQAPFDGHCQRLRLLASQARAAEQRRAREEASAR